MTSKQEQDLHKDIAHLTRWLQGSIAVGIVFFSAFAWQMNNQSNSIQKQEDRFYELLNTVNESNTATSLKVQKLELTKMDK